MSTPAVANNSIMEDVIVKGDLAKLSPDQRARYYAEVCQSMGLNELTQPFQYLSLNGKLTLYATKTATDQLRKVRGVSIFKVDAETLGDLRIVHAYARDASGREDMDIGAVNIKGLQGEALANAMMKCLTKAKRRVTLSICGLGWMDELEIDAIPSARPINVNVETGEIIDSPGDAEVAETEVIDAQPQARSGLPPTPKQFAFIHSIATELGMDDGQLHEFAGVPSLNDLDRGEVSDLIERLKALQADAPTAVPADVMVSWTVFWNRARELGYPNDLDQMKGVIGELGPNPQHALDRLLAVKRERQPALS